MSVPSLRVYPRLVRCAFQQRAAYRLANLTGISVNFFFFLIHAQVFLAFFQGERRVVGWSSDETVLYFATSESLLMALGAMSQGGTVQFVQRIRSGDIVGELARPLRLWARHVCMAYGDGVYYLLGRAIPLYAAATFWYGLRAPLSGELLWLPLSLVLAIGIGAQLSYLVAATAYWIENARGSVRVHMFSCFLFGGVVVPLDFYPDTFRALCDVLPYRGLVYTPIALATGKLAGPTLVHALAHQLLWFAGLTLASEQVERSGTRRLAVMGG